MEYYQEWRTFRNKKHGQALGADYEQHHGACFGGMSYDPKLTHLILGLGGHEVIESDLVMFFGELKKWFPFEWGIDNKSKYKRRDGLDKTIYVKYWIRIQDSDFVHAKHRLLFLTYARIPQEIPLTLTLYREEFEQKGIDLSDVALKQKDIQIAGVGTYTYHCKGGSGHSLAYGKSIYRPFDTILFNNLSGLESSIHGLWKE